jgi:hypothetical protein
MNTPKSKIESEPKDSIRIIPNQKEEENSNTITRKEKQKEYNRIYREKRLDELRFRSRQYYHLNRQKRKDYCRKWRLKNKTKLKLYFKSKKDSDPNFKIACSLRTRMSMALRQENKTGSAVRDLGCSINEFREYLSSKFSEGMTWENYGEWHIDHIIPLSKFNLSKRVEFLKAAHFTNLQPLWEQANLAKSNR